MAQVRRIVDLHDLVPGAVGAVVQLAHGESAGTLADPRVIELQVGGGRGQRVAGRVAHDPFPLETLGAAAGAELEDAAFGAG